MVDFTAKSLPSLPGVLQVRVAEVLWRHRDICGGHTVSNDEADKAIFGSEGEAYQVTLQRRRPLLAGGFGRRLFHGRRRRGRWLDFDDGRGCGVHRGMVLIGA